MHVIHALIAIRAKTGKVLLDMGEQDYTSKGIALEITNTHKSVIVAADICRDNVKAVNQCLLPYAVEVSEGLETNSFDGWGG